MLPRRHIRIKVFQTLYSRSQRLEDNSFSISKEFRNNLNSYLNLYYFLIELLFLIKEVATDQIAIKRNNLIPSNQDLQPNKKLIKNQVLKRIKIRKNKNFEDREELKNIVNTIFNNIKNTKSYIEYMNIDKSILEEDKNFILHILKTHFISNEKIHEFIEDYSIYWNDDLLVTYNLLVEKIKNHDPLYDVTLFRQKEDEDFAENLLNKTIANEDKINKTISSLAKNWDSERIATADLILIKMAITEITYIKDIPNNVSLDEYIEISKEYSTPKSKEFINGILDVFIKTILPTYLKEK
jgi:N utilization substance protein B